MAVNTYGAAHQAMLSSPSSSLVSSYGIFNSFSAWKSFYWVSPAFDSNAACASFLLFFFFNLMPLQFAPYKELASIWLMPGWIPNRKCGRNNNRDSSAIAYKFIILFAINVFTRDKMVTITCASARTDLGLGVLGGEVRCYTFAHWSLIAASLTVWSWSLAYEHARVCVCKQQNEQ